MAVSPSKPGEIRQIPDSAGVFSAGKVMPPDAGLEKAPFLEGRKSGLAGTAFTADPAGLKPERPVPGELSGQPDTPAVRNSEAEKINGLLSALKLPFDTLSKDILSFARHFSLPLETETLHAMRREALAQKKRGAAALGMAAAASKGITLEGRALEEYAGAIEPWDADYGRGGGENTGNGGNKTKEHKKLLRAGIQKSVTEVLEKRPALDFINRLPGKNGRWVVIPFSFSDNELELRVSFRMLLAENSVQNTGQSAGDVRRFVADILITRRSDMASRRWFFMIDGEKRKLEFAAEPPLRASENLTGELARTFGVDADNVMQRNDLPSFPDMRSILPSVDEEV